MNNKKGGPFKELLEVDVLINAILCKIVVVFRFFPTNILNYSFFDVVNADNPPPPFVTLDMVDEESRQTTVLVDVSCDVNPIVYTRLFLLIFLSRAHRALIRPIPYHCTRKAHRSLIQSIVCATRRAKARKCLT